jgi:hypothetical protein
VEGGSNRERNIWAQLRSGSHVKVKHIKVVQYFGNWFDVTFTLLVVIVFPLDYWIAKVRKIGTVVFSFIFDNYCPIVD